MIIRKLDNLPPRLIHNGSWLWCVCVYVPIHVEGDNNIDLVVASTSTEFYLLNLLTNSSTPFTDFYY